MNRRRVAGSLGFAAMMLVGYGLMSTARPDRVNASRPSGPAVLSQPRVVADDALPVFRRQERPAVQAADHGDGELAQQRVILFKDAEAMARFLARAGRNLRVLGRLDALQALRVGYANESDLLAALGADDETAQIFPVVDPLPRQVGAQPGAVPLGDRLRSWLGIAQEGISDGQGIRVAVLDTGVVAHPTFKNPLLQRDLIAAPENSAQQNGHGTAVASVIAGQQVDTPGVAPGVEILSIRIADDQGISDSFLLAQGIVAAVDAGADLINISMGSEGDSGVIRKAIQYAQAHGVLLVAAAGNQGLAQVAYPAANQGVIAVAAVDAMGSHLDFSNSGESIDLAAPGYQLNAAWTDGQTVAVSGTSFSAPVVTGALAVIMASQGVTAREAYQQLSAYLNDAGAAGADAEFGGGMPDLGRVLNAKVPGIYDAAVASSRIISADPAHPYGQVEILVQNRGTARLLNTTLQVALAGGNTTSNITSLAPQAVQALRFPINQPISSFSNGLRVDANVALSGKNQDVKPSNNQRIETWIGK